VVNLQDNEDDLVSMCAEAALGRGDELTAAVRHGKGRCLILPTSALAADRRGACAIWASLRFPTAAPVDAVRGMLAAAGVQALALAAPCCSGPCVLVRGDRLADAAAALVGGGFALGPLARLPAPEPPREDVGVAGRAGVWAGAGRGEEVDVDGGSTGAVLPYAVRFESGTGLFVDIRVPTCTDPASPHSVEASCAGTVLPHASGEGFSRRRLVDLRPPRPQGVEDGDRDCSSWRCIAEGCTAVLELFPGGGRRGFWLFAGGLFARVLGLAPGEGVVAGHCCRSLARLALLRGTAVAAELRTQYEALLGRVERPGALRALRSSWGVPAGDLLYDAEGAAGGQIDVDEEMGVVTHWLPGGVEQRWRILKMSEDPFTPPGRPPMGPESGRRGEAGEPSRSPSPELLAGALDGVASSEGHKKDSHKEGNTKKMRKHASDGSCSPVAEVRKDKACDKEREKGRDNEKERERDKDRDKEGEKDREKDRDKIRDKDRDRERDKDKEKDLERSPSHRKPKHRDRSRSVPRDRSSRSKSRERDRRNHEGRSRSWSKRRKDRRRKDVRSDSRERAKSKDRDKEKNKEKDKERDREKEKDKERQKEKEREREKKEREKDKDRSRSPRKDRDKEKLRSRSPQRRSGKSGFDQREPAPDAPAAPQAPARQQPPNSLISMMAESAVSSIVTQSSPEVEAFLAMNTVEPHAASRLRSLPPEMQRLVIERGSLFGARDPSAVLISRVRDATMGGAQSMGLGVPAPPLVNPVGVHHGIEMLIARYNLDARCAQMLRSLPPDRQALAAELPVHEARNPSAFVMAQLQLPHFQAGAPPSTAARPGVVPQLLSMPGGAGQPPLPSTSPPSSMFQVV